jgi:hypothetical protein
MSRPTIRKFLQSSTQKVSPFRIPARSFICLHQTRLCSSTISQVSYCPQLLSKRRRFSSGQQQYKGITPESADPSPKTPESTSPKASAPANISIDEYHNLSDVYLNSLVEQLEQLQEEREEVDCEYTVGSLSASNALTN